jgi:hypothetical protein
MKGLKFTVTTEKKNCGNPIKTKHVKDLLDHFILVKEMLNAGIGRPSSVSVIR